MTASPILCPLFAAVVSKTTPTTESAAPLFTKALCAAVAVVTPLGECHGQADHVKK
jgi:hypothetical protein